jgi:hypothetical protein
MLANDGEKAEEESEDDCLLGSGGHVVCIGKWEIILVGKPKGKIAFGKPEKMGG